MNKGLEIAMPFLSHRQHGNRENQSERKKREKGVMLFSFDPAAFKMGPNAGRASPVPSEHPLKLTMGYFISKSDFILRTHTRCQTFISLPVSETKQAWRAIKCLLCQVFYLQVQLEEQPVGFQKDAFVQRTKER